MKSFYDLKKLKKLAFRFDELLQPEEQKNLDKFIIESIDPTFDPNEPLPSSFALTEIEVEDKAPIILKALLKYPFVRIKIGNVEFDIRRDRNFYIRDILRKPVALVEQYRPTTFKLELGNLKNILYKMSDFVTNLKNKKAKILQHLKQAILKDAEAIEDIYFKRTAFTESLGLLSIRNALNITSKALKELKIKFKAGQIKEMLPVFDAAIHALSMGRSVASLDFELDSGNESRIKTTTLEKDEEETLEE